VGRGLLAQPWIFAIVMSEFLPASLLPVIAGDLRISEGTAGQAVSVTAFAAALSALLMSVRMPRTDRRRVMIGLTLLAAASNLLAALAPSLAVLSGAGSCWASRGGFWAMTTAMASHLLPADQVGRALTVVNSGVAAATVVAIPLGTWLVADRAAHAEMFSSPGSWASGCSSCNLVASSSAGLFVGAAGFGFGGVPTTILTWGVRDEPARLEQVSELIVMVWNVGIAAGATVGGVPMDGLSASAPLVAGGVAVIAGTALLVSASRAHRLTLDSR